MHGWNETQAESYSSPAEVQIYVEHWGMIWQNWPFFDIGGDNLAKLINFRYMGGWKLAIQERGGGNNRGSKGEATSLRRHWRSANKFLQFWHKKTLVLAVFCMEKGHAESAITMDNAKISQLLSKGRRISEKKLQSILTWDRVKFML